MMTLEELTKVVNDLKKLLDDPQPGLYSWNSIVAALVQRIVDGVK